MRLCLNNINSYYGLSHILHDVSLYIDNNEVVSILGRNGAGKTTTLKSIMGLVSVKSGSITLDNTDITQLQTHKIADHNICFVPETRGIFRVLTVEENLKLAARKNGRWTLDTIYRIFPRLKERRRNGGEELSGGEQQMLAIGRALMNGPELLILDEPTEGLAPVIVDEIVDQLRLIKDSGLSIILVEQNLEICAGLSDRHYILEGGRVVYTASNEVFKEENHIWEKFLTVGSEI